MSIQREQFSTFYVAGQLYGIDVTKVQEIVKPMQTTRIPLAESVVEGLINLRGQVVTAISLHELFSLSEKRPAELMNVICKFEGGLISLLVDEIGDVMEIDESESEMIPNTVPESIRRYMSKVYKVNSELLSILDVERILITLNG